jgi:hypothetical protein
MTALYVIPLDKLVESLVARQEKIETRTFSTKFPFYAISNKNRISLLNLAELWETRQAWKIKAENVKPPTLASKPLRIYYVRHKNEFLLGLNFEKKLAKMVVHDIQNFIKSDLHLNNYNSRFSYCYSKSLRFLGFNISFYPVKVSIKSPHTAHLKKIKASLQRKKVAESEKYFKLVEHVNSVMHRRFLNSIYTTGQAIIKRSEIKSCNDYSINIKVVNALKLSLSQVESEILLSRTKSHIFRRNDGAKTEPILNVAGCDKKNSVISAIYKWIQKATDLVKEEDRFELEAAVGNFLSPKFLRIRKSYLAELGKISSKNFNERKIGLANPQETQKNMSDAKVDLFLTKVGRKLCVLFLFWRASLRKPFNWQPR